MTGNRQTPAMVFPPGDTIREELEERGWTQSDLATVMGRPVAAINEIINGKRKITPKTAAELEAALGPSAGFWLNLEAIYQRSLAPEPIGAAERAKVLGYGPIKEMQKRGWLPKTTDFNLLAEKVCEFFGVDSLDQQPPLGVSFRHSSDDVSVSHVAWTLRAQTQAKLVKASPFKKSNLPSIKGAVRELAAQSDDIRRVPMVLADFGVRLVIVKHLQSTKIDGAAFWLDRRCEKHPVIALSLRHGRIDNFWHTLCHELSHIEHRDALHLDDTSTFVEGEGEDEIENRANADAAGMLIDQDQLQRFILRKKPYFSAKSIIQFANTIQMHPGVIVGQLQYRKAVKWTHHQKMLIQIRDRIVETAITDGWDS